MSTAEVEVETEIVRVKRLPVSKAGFAICFQFRDDIGLHGDSFGEGEDYLWAITNVGEQPFNITEIVLGNKIVQLNGSHGLLLCYNERDRNYLSVWNPATGTLRHLPRCLEGTNFPMFDGFGFDPTTRSYVVVRGYDYYPHDIMDSRFPYALYLHVYHSQSANKKPKWKEIIIHRTRRTCFTPKGSAIFSKGVFYWRLMEGDIFAFKPPYNENSWDFITDPFVRVIGRVSLTGCDGTVMLVYQNRETLKMWRLTDQHQWHAFCDVVHTQFGDPGLNCTELKVALRPNHDFLLLSMTKRTIWLCNSVGTIVRVIVFKGKLPSQKPYNVCTFDFETTATDVTKL